jgi:NADH:ubiquinone oxidoreductase subunit 5 (subunit L)/multisubunit Na+/H+ antiporter MnhA subunit
MVAVRKFGATSIALLNLSFNRLNDLSNACALFDGRLIDGIVEGTLRLVRMLSKVCIWWDKWVIDGLVNFAGKFMRLLSHPIRMFQSGVLSTYAVFMLLGLALLLGYYGYHMLGLVRSLR